MFFERPSISSATTASGDGAYEDERRGLDEADFSRARIRLQQLTTDLSRYPQEPLRKDTVQHAIESYVESQGRFIDLCSIVFPELAYTVIPMLLAKILNPVERREVALTCHKALENVNPADGIKKQVLARWAHSLKTSFDLAFGHFTGYEPLLRSFFEHVLEPLSIDGKRIWRGLLFDGPFREEMPIGYDAESSGYGSDDEASSEISADTLSRPATPSNVTAGSPTIYIPAQQRS